MENVERITEVLNRKGLNALLRVTSKDSRKARL